MAPPPAMPQLQAWVLLLTIACMMVCRAANPGLVPVAFDNQDNQQRNMVAITFLNAGHQTVAANFSFRIGVQVGSPCY